MRAVGVIVELRLWGGLVDGGRARGRESRRASGLGGSLNKEVRNGQRCSNKAEARAGANVWSGDGGWREILIAWTGSVWE